MKVYKTNEIKNIALLGSKGSGKTTLAESMLFPDFVASSRSPKIMIDFQLDSKNFG